MCVDCIMMCFFKQKTAYEMRISDWSSDVCSSDLHGLFVVASVRLFSLSLLRADVVLISVYLIACMDYCAGQEELEDVFMNESEPLQFSIKADRKSVV